MKSRNSPVPHHSPRRPGAMQALLNATDWSGTALGPRAAWPACIRTAVSIVMHARQPMAVAWGPAFNILYNDSYRDLLGIRGERAEETFGQPISVVWPKLADESVESMQRAMAGQPDYDREMPYLSTRNGSPEVIYMNISTSPVCDDDGVPQGVFCTIVESTAGVTAQQERDAALADIVAMSKRLRLATELTELGMFEVDLERDEILIDTSMRRFGLVPGIFPRPDIYALLVHPGHRARVAAFVADFYAAPGDGYYAAEYRSHDTSDGQERWLAARGQLIFDEDGKPIRLLGTTLDISARKREQAAARQSAEQALAAVDDNLKYRTFFTQGSHFAILMSTTGVVLEVNQVALDTCGFARDQVVGKPLWDCGWWHGSPDAILAVHAGVATAAAGRKVHHKLSYFTAGGVALVGQMSIAPVLDDAGQVVYLAGTGIDITEREAIEARLRLLDAIGENTRVALAPEAILEGATRMLGEYLQVTRVAYADLEPDNDRFTIRHDWTAPGAFSAVGVYSLDLFGPRATASMRGGHTLRIDDTDRELGANEGTAMFDRIGVKAIICCPLVKDGKLVAMMAVHQEVPRSWSAGEVALVEAVVERCWAHIERVRAVEELRATDRRKSEFLAVLAHELRNPLAPIRNGIDMLRISTNNPAAAAKVRDMMERQVTHMVHLINDLLDVARVNNGKVVLQPEPVDLRQMLVNAIESSAAAMEAARHVITLDTVAPGAVVFDADPVRLAQVLGNLLSNAIKYTPPGGRLQLSGHRSGDIVDIRLQDSGIGIPAEHLSSVFDMFTQVSRSLEHARGGLGIGLSLVQRLVELHGGTVSATSAGLGQGSTFIVRLPAPQSTQQPAGTDAQSPVDVIESGHTPLRILVADDNVDAADTMCALLEASGYVTRIAYDGAEALAIGTAFQPHVVLLDLGMPRLDGFETAQRMRAMPALCGAVLVAVTGWGAASDRARSRAAGFDHHLLKPASMQQVQEILTAVEAARYAAYGA